ncbi:MAG TPA: NAD(P)-dependent alcohol dehydrogenase [Kofleriaceae bacterium]
MTIDAHGFAAHSATEPLVPFRFERRDPRPDDVVIEILFCGVCHSDIHNVRNDWGGAKYPMVPGHEIVGRITRVGAEVKRFRVGDQVGVGCLVDSCRQCSACKRGEENYCKDMVLTYADADRRDQRPTFGGYSNTIVVTESFVVRVPDSLDLKGAAPLLCAGITTWSPLRYWKVGKGTKLAVVGLGGLGHMALKLGKALGADVTLFTRSPGKEADARRLGANRVVVSTDAQQMDTVSGAFDVILDTVPYVHDVNAYMPTLATNGTLVLLGYLGPLEPPLNSAPMVMGRKTVAGSLIGGIAETQRMLDFCGEHDITSDIEIIEMRDINRSFERMLKSDVKYRFVIDLASLQRAQ